MQKKGNVLLSTSLAWPAVAGCSQAEIFSQLSSLSFAQPCKKFGAENMMTKSVFFLRSPGKRSRSKIKITYTCSDLDHTKDQDQLSDLDLLDHDH